MSLLSLVGKKVVVRRLRDGRVQLGASGQGELRWRALPQRPQRNLVERRSPKAAGGSQARGGPIRGGSLTRRGGGRDIGGESK